MQRRMSRILSKVSVLGLLLLLTVYFFILKLTSIDLRPQTLISSIFPPTGNQGVGASRRELALQLRFVTDQLSRALSQQKPPSLSTIQSLQRIVEDLEPTFALNNDNASVNSSIEICPEHYVNSTYGYPHYFKGWERTNCDDAPSLDTLISIVLNPDEKCSYLKWILFGIREKYPSIVVILPGKYTCTREFKNLRNVDIIPVASHASEGEVWNLLISAVETKYVLVGRGIYYFNWYAQLERTIDVMGTDPRISVVGGTVRNISGHWQVGCFQSSVHNYALEYQEGYHASKNDCMFCDYILSPFVARTEVLMKLQFDSLLSSSVLFEDFFFRLQHRQKHFVISCPDVMHFKTDSEFVRSKQLWTGLAKKLSLNRISPRKGVTYHYSCEESGISCKYLYTTTKAFLMPICCLEEYQSAMAFLQRMEDENNLRIELDTGSVLGAVKFQGIIPWDIDADISYCSFNHTFLEQSKELFAKSGFKLETVQSASVNSKTGKASGGFFRLYTPNSIIELYGIDKMSADLPDVLPKSITKQTTKVSMNGIWISGPANPGLFVRNRYRSNYLKHAQSWRHTGGESSWVNYEIASFRPCPEFNHHACLDRYFTDGNIQFQLP